MYLARLGALPGFKLPTGSLVMSYGMVSSNAIDGSVIDGWAPTKTDGSNPGFDTKRRCFYWGHRPEEVQLMGVHGLGAVWGGGQAFTICPPGECPPAPSCPPCASSSSPPFVPQGPGGYGDDDKGLLGKFGTPVGLLVAAALTGGVGYYGYKKGWFKRKKK